MTFTTTKTDETSETTYEFATELLESRRDWLPYIFGAGGWIAAIVAILVR